MPEKSEKLSLAQCRKTLHTMNPDLSDKEVLAIRDFLCLLAEIEHSIFVEEAKNKQEGVVIPLSNPETNENQRAA